MISQASPQGRNSLTESVLSWPLIRIRYLSLSIMILPVTAFTEILFCALVDKAMNIFCFLKNEEQITLQAI